MSTSSSCAGWPSLGRGVGNGGGGAEGQGVKAEEARKMLVWRPVRLRVCNRAAACSHDPTHSQCCVPLQQQQAVHATVTHQHRSHSMRAARSTTGSACPNTELALVNHDQASTSPCQSCNDLLPVLQLQQRLTDNTLVASRRSCSSGWRCVHTSIRPPQQQLPGSLLA